MTTSLEQTEQIIDPRRFREILAHAPTAVAVVTAVGPTGPIGLAVGSFVSVSLDPALIGFFPARTSTSWPVLRTAGRFCVNLLAGDQVELSHAFARSGGDKFAGIDWYPSPAGSPILRGCVTWIDCQLHQEIETGDHALVLGRVLGLDVARDAKALVFHRGGYAQTSLAETIDHE